MGLYISSLLIKTLSQLQLSFSEHTMKYSSINRSTEATGLRRFYLFAAGFGTMLSRFLPALVMSCLVMGSSGSSSSSNRDATSITQSIWRTPLHGASDPTRRRLNKKGEECECSGCRKPATEKKMLNGTVYWYCSYACYIDDTDI